MDLLDLLNAVKEVVGHNNVRWDVDPETKEVRLYSGLTMRLPDGTVDPTHTLRETAGTVVHMEMES